MLNIHKHLNRWTHAKHQQVHTTSVYGISLCKFQNYLFKGKKLRIFINFWQFTLAGTIEDQLWPSLQMVIFDQEREVHNHTAEPSSSIRCGTNNQHKLCLITHKLF